ncbi:MAG TPA: redoxin domain-containing protein [Thermoplasmata archaeon]
MPELKVGDTAPDFELEDQNEKKVRLSQFRGKKNVMLVFYPLAFSPVCTNELGELKEKEETILKLNAQILAASIDSTWTLKAFSKDLGVKFPLLSDFGRKTAPMYGSYYEDKGFAKRTVFVVDKLGKVAYKREYEPATQPDIEEALSVLRKLK